jgi:hypothetical protein
MGADCASYIKLPTFVSYYLRETQKTAKYLLCKKFMNYVG